MLPVAGGLLQRASTAGAPIDLRPRLPDCSASFCDLHSSFRTVFFFGKLAKIFGTNVRGADPLIRPGDAADLCHAKPAWREMARMGGGDFATNSDAGDREAVSGTIKISWSAGSTAER